MDATKKLQANMDAQLYEQVNKVLELLGLTPTTAVTMFYRKIAAEGRIPFEIALTKGQQEQLAFETDFSSTLQTFNAENHINPYQPTTDEEGVTRFSENAPEGLKEWVKHG